MRHIKQAVAKLIREKALSKGEFQFSAGGQGKYYIDMRKLTTNVDDLNTVVHALYLLGRENEFTLDRFDSVGGPASGAIPLVMGMMLGADISRSFYVRNTPRDHGLCRRIEGCFCAGDRVLLVDDVATTGRSLCESVDAIEEAGARVVLALAVVDREEGAAAMLGKRGIPFHSILTLSECLL